jgi:hypothetical protein
LPFKLSIIFFLILKRERKVVHYYLPDGNILRALGDPICGGGVGKAEGCEGEGTKLLLGLRSCCC